MDDFKERLDKARKELPEGSTIGDGEKAGYYTIQEVVAYYAKLKLPWEEPFNDN